MAAALSSAVAAAVTVVVELELELAKPAACRSASLIFTSFSDVAQSSSLSASFSLASGIGGWSGWQSAKYRPEKKWSDAHQIAMHTAVFLDSRLQTAVDRSCASLIDVLHETAAARAKHASHTTENTRNESPQPATEGVPVVLSPSFRNNASVSRVTKQHTSTHGWTANADTLVPSSRLPSPRTCKMFSSFVTPYWLHTGLRQLLTQTRTLNRYTLPVTGSYRSAEILWRL